MNSKSANQAMSQYLQEILKLYQRDVPPKIDAYCSVLKDLLYSSLEFLPGNKSTGNIEIEINQKLLRMFHGSRGLHGMGDLLKMA